MEDKLTKKNSIFFNQLWINKIIEEGRIDLLPCNKPENGLSIGEYLEEKYNNEKEYERPKITKKNSILYEREWIKKYQEEGLHIIKHKSKIYCIGELLAIKYFEREMILNYKNTEKDKCLELK